MYTHSFQINISSVIKYLINKFYFLKTVKFRFFLLKYPFTVQNSKPLEKEDKVNLTLIINWCNNIKKWDI